MPCILHHPCLGHANAHSSQGRGTAADKAVALVSENARLRKGPATFGPALRQPDTCNKVVGGTTPECAAVYQMPCRQGAWMSRAAALRLPGLHAPAQPRFSGAPPGPARSTGCTWFWWLVGPAVRRGNEDGSPIKTSRSAPCGAAVPPRRGRPLTRQEPRLAGGRDLKRIVMIDCLRTQAARRAPAAARGALVCAAGRGRRGGEGLKKVCVWVTVCAARHGVGPAARGVG